MIGYIFHPQAASELEEAAAFPYSIVYRANADIIVIIAVAHQRRRPGYWRDRS